MLLQLIQFQYLFPNQILVLDIIQFLVLSDNFKMTIQKDSTVAECGYQRVISPPVVRLITRKRMFEKIQ